MCIRDSFTIEDDAEVAIEVDPRVTTFEQLKLLRSLGFNRLSMGVQDFDPQVQDAVNRVQPYEITKQLYDQGRDLGYHSINIDLIYGLPLQSPEGFGRTIEQVIGLRPDRVAVYSYAFVPWIKANQKRIEKEDLPPAALKLELFCAARNQFLEAGYEAIGMDHFAVPEDEMASAARDRTLHRNFMGYTLKMGSDMVGVGTSAIGDVAGAFAQNEKKLSTYKAAITDLPLGGGKSVIIGDPRRDKSPALLRAMGRAVENLQGRYIVAEDVGTTVDDMAHFRAETVHVAGLAPEKGGSGDPSPSTALGVLMGIRAAVDYRKRPGGLAGATVAVQGLGNVGYNLCRLLAAEGARLIVADIREGSVRRAVAEFGATAAATDAILAAEADIFAPCALGAVVDDTSVPQLRAGIVAGSANNQLAEARHGEALAKRGILYAPDYVINAGGVIQVGSERTGHSAERVRAKVEGLYDTVLKIFERADRQGIPTSAAADRIAEERFRPHRPASLAA